RHREVAGEHAVDVAVDVGSALRPNDARLAEPGADERILVSFERVEAVPLPGTPSGSQVAADDLADLVVWDRRVARAVRLGPSLDGVPDKRVCRARLEPV